MILKRNNVSWFILLIIPFVAYFYYFFKYAQNIPFEDDIAVMRNWLNVLKTNDFLNYIKEILKPANEHPIAVSKFFFGIQLFLFGQQNFIILMLVGNLIFLSSFIVLYKIITEAGFSKYYFLPIPYLILSLYYYESSLWAICSFQYNAIFALFFWGLYLTFNNTKPYNFGLGIFFLVLTAICNGNGIIGILIVTFLLLLTQNWQKLLILAISLVFVKIFLLHNSYYKTPNEIPIIIKSFMILIGGILKVQNKPLINILIGGLSFLIFSILGLNFLIKNFKIKFRSNYELQLFAIGLFCIGTILGISIFRGTDSSVFPDRYRLYPQFFVVIIYLLSLPFIKKSTYHNRFLFTFLSFSCIYWLISYKLEKQNLINQFNQIRFGAVNYINAQTCLEGIYYRGYFDETITGFKQNKMYDITQNSDAERVLNIIKKATIVEDNLEFNISKDKSENIIIENNSIIQEEDNDNFSCLVLINEQNIRYHIPVKNKNIGLMASFELNPKHAGFFGVIPKLQLLPANYTLYILNNNKEKSVLYKTNYTINAQQMTFSKI